MAEQPETVPPLAPVQLQLQGPVPVIVVAIPVEHKFAAGMIENVPPLLDPQVPFTIWGVIELAEQLEVVPPYAPVQFQFHGPVPVVVVAVPAEHKFAIGTTANVPPLLEPQVPLIA